MELRQLRYFVEIADQASFTRAAETLAIAQPALTAQMHKLEAELGAPLFIRAPRGITLTGVGDAVIDLARATLAAADVTKRAAQLAAELDDAAVVVAYSRTFPVAPLARIVGGFRRERPNLRLDMREMWSNEQIEAVADGTVDVAFGQLFDIDRERLADRGIEAVVLGEESLSLAVPSSHPLASRRQVTLAELAGESFVLPSSQVGESIRGWVLAAARAAGFTPRIVQEAADLRLVLGLVSANLGIALMFSGNRDMRLRNVHYVSIVPTLALAFGVLYRRGYGGQALAPLLERIQREELA
jgi:DNA-binding transcriptional LysR family regulator